MKKILFSLAVLWSAAAAAAETTAAADSLNDVSVEEVEVQGRQKGTVISRINPITTEKISSAGLKKLACCNLAESFENSATVTVGFSDAVSGTRQIRMLGLTGTYTQMLDESRVGIRGLGSAYGLSYTPGAWLQGIQISKGTASVASGYEAIAGQINLDYRKPEGEDLLFVNAYFNSDLRGELNLASSFEATPKLRGVVLLHASGDPQMTDVDNNNFADQPQTKQINVANRWLYSVGSGALLHAGWQLIAEDRQGGQLNFNRRTDRDSLNKYGSYILNRRLNAFAKFGVPLGDDEHNSFALIGDYTLHDQESFFGQKIYNGTEQSAYLNALLQLEFREMHHLNFGLTARGDFYDETIKLPSSLSPEREILNGFLKHENEVVAGFFGEYTLNLADKLTAIAGVRLDQNNLYGTLLTPRAHLKYNITETLIVRASAGRGMHSPNLIADNIWMMASNRQIEVLEKPKMEDAWTYGLSLTAYIHKDEQEIATVSADVFHTEFTNQLIVDQEVSGNRIAIYNLDGRSYANNYQIDVNLEPVQRLGIFATFRYSDTRVNLTEMGMQQKPLIDRFKGLLNVSYATKFNKWMFDATAQINGQNRLPSSQYVKYDYDASEYSPVYPMFFAQVTRRHRNLEVYVGCENIANYMQKNPVISAGDPAGNDFNASVVWGPLMGRKFYIGMRYTIPSWKR
ncbi:TonB-dependent receptor [Bacteroidia bacterium]|nr:TonB-dependent receptor [Bacteroidia bacterium]